MSRASRSCVAAAIAAAILNCASPAGAGDHGRNDHRGWADWDGRGGKHHERDEGSIKLKPLATYDAGEAGSAEIVAFDAASKRLFLVNAATASVDILDVRNPSRPKKLSTIDTAALGSPNSVAVHAGLVAVANASNDDRNFDSRSDNKGPEPEGLAVGQVGQRRYAFVGLERMGGVMVYDITQPHSPLFVDYANNRDFSVAPYDAPAAGDLGPEGLLFIDAKDSPTRSPLLVVANEVSGTVTLYQIERE